MHRLCPAKVNLALSVGPRGSDGYHPIASWMVAVSLVDELAVRRAPSGAASSFDIAWSDDAPRPGTVDWPLEKDLTVKAHRLLEAHVEHSLPVAVTLRKRIPAGAGLAGGSSDSAAMLVAMNDLFDLRLDDAALLQLAVQLGSDVGFFLRSPSAVVSGRGEVIQPAPLPGPIHLTLILPDLTCPTGDVYAAFDELNASPTVDPLRVDELAQSDVLAPDAPFNDLAEAARRVTPPLAELQRQCARALKHPVHITGSGAGMFAVASDEVEANRMARTIATSIPVAALAVRTID